jgi:nicotinamide mononucleotide transporter
MNSFTDFFVNNWIELAGAAAACIYLFFSIRQSILLWLCGIATSVFYIYVFGKSALYADMGLQFYYLIVSIYGWFVWAKGGVTKNKSEMPVAKLSLRLTVKLFVVHGLIYVALLLMLLYLPEKLGFSASSLPYLDALTTSASIVATWMIARKYIENWLIWIFVDALSAGMYIYKELWITSVLFVIYTIAAVIGYRAWKNDMIKRQ